MSSLVSHLEAFYIATVSTVAVTFPVFSMKLTLVVGGVEVMCSVKRWVNARGCIPVGLR